MAEIVDMKGNVVPQEIVDAVTENKPWVNPAVVSMLEQYLEAAKQGAIVSFGIATVGNNGHNFQTFVCAPNTNFPLHSSVDILSRRVADYVRTGNVD